MEPDKLRNRRLHILFFPLMALGHIVPTLDLVKLFAQRGVRCTVVTIAAFANVVNLAIKNTPCVDLHLIPVPSSIDSTHTSVAFLFSLHLLRPSIEAILKDLHPTAVVADMCFPWTTALCAELGVPRLVFSGTSTFSRCATASYCGLDINEVRDDQAVVLHHLPHRIQLLKTQVPDQDSTPQLITMLKEAEEAEKGSYGELINSFYELEPDYVRHNKEVLGRRAWLIGPLSLWNQEPSKLSMRGASEDSPLSLRCQEWLDSKSTGSVLYICFGSLLPISRAQFQQIALALESIQHPFLWVVRDSSAGEAPLPWLSKAIEKKEATGACLLVRGWAPQAVILNHPSVGGFMTHCGWNSSLESITAGVPMATWPLGAEQFYNERLLVDVLNIGVPVGSKQYSNEGDRSVIAAANIEPAIERLMGNTEEARVRRQKAKELAASARRAVLEGGSSFRDVDNFIKQLEVNKP